LKNTIKKPHRKMCGASNIKNNLKNITQNQLTNTLKSPTKKPQQKMGGASAIKHNIKNVAQN
jgi:hypothetical protein